MSLIIVVFQNLIELMKIAECRVWRDPVKDCKTSQKRCPHCKANCEICKKITVCIIE